MTKPKVSKYVAEKRRTNVVARIAVAGGLVDGDGWPYATSADVTEAFRHYPEDVVRRDVLEILSGGGGVGYEDAKGMAFVAWQGKAGLDDRDNS